MPIHKQPPTTKAALLLLISGLLTVTIRATAQPSPTLQNRSLSVSLTPHGESYEISAKGSPKPVLQARVGAKVNHQWLDSGRYTETNTVESAFTDELGKGRQLTTVFAGLAGQPSLVRVLRIYDDLPFGDVEVRVRNSTDKPVWVQAIRSVDAVRSPIVNLGGPEQDDRILSDSFSEDRPTLRIYDLGKAPAYLGFDRFGTGTTDSHLAVGSQLIYNLQTRQSLFLGALSSRIWLTLLRLRAAKLVGGGFGVGSYEVDSTGTTEMQKHESLQKAPPENQVELNMPVAPGAEIASERLLFATGSNYHAQLEAYGAAVKRLNHARVSSEAPVGWWSWATYYAGITDGLALTNAQFMAEHLKDLGYKYVLIDEGYQYARGEYTTADATHFPSGMQWFGNRIRNLGVSLGVWTAPFEVSERAWVYEHHKEWLVHNDAGQPIQIVQPGLEPLYVLDTTHPGAQEYLLQTYRTLARDWGARYIKLDFMEDTAIEGYHYERNTTALQAQRIGLEVIRKAVGEDVLLDKDGSPMLNPVGIVDEGRISTDTAHSFEASKTAAFGIAARYYMNRNFFINDPDAFTVSKQSAGRSDTPPTLDEAEVSIVLAAVAGSMYEIGDDLTRLATEPGRLALAENQEMLRMIRLGRASTPLDLMSYSEADGQPSIFVLREDKRQTMLAVFNWTGHARSHTIPFTDLHLGGGKFQVADVLHPDRPVRSVSDMLELTGQPPHSVRLIKIIDTSIAPGEPSVILRVPASAQIGQPAKMFAAFAPEGVPATNYKWDFGDGVSAQGDDVSHSYTRAGTYSIKVTADGIDGLAAHKTASIAVSGTIDGGFHFGRNRRYVETAP